MAANLTLDEFLSQLASQHGLHRKVRMLARYWRQVQSLPPEGRERVALALGSRAAWNRLETLFNRDGTLSEGELAVKRALESVGRANPSELRTLAKRVRSGDYAGIGKDLVDVVGKALDEEAETAEPGAEVTELGTEVTEPGTEVTEPGTAAPAPGVAPARSELASEEPDEVPAEVEFEAEDQLSSTALPERPVLTQPEASAPEAPAPPAAEVAHPNEPASADETPWEEHAPEMVTLSSRECLAELRRLRSEVGYGAGLGPEGRVRLLQRLGSGWARRRGLSQMIRSGSIGDVDEALQLIDRLETPIQRSWCLGDLVEHGDLAEAEAARVLDAAPNAAARRRLQRRAAKHSRDCARPL